MGLKPIGNPEFCPDLEAETLLWKAEELMMQRSSSLLNVRYSILSVMNQKTFVDVILKMHAPNIAEFV